MLIEEPVVSEVIRGLRSVSADQRNHIPYFAETYTQLLQLVQADPAIRPKTQQGPAELACAVSWAEVDGLQMVVGLRWTWRYMSADDPRHLQESIRHTMGFCETRAAFIEPLIVEAAKWAKNIYPFAGGSLIVCEDGVTAARFFGDPNPFSFTAGHGRLLQSLIALHMHRLGLTPYATEETKSEGEEPGRHVHAAQSVPAAIETDSLGKG